MALKGEPFKKILGALRQLAPTVLTAVGGPMGAVAGTIIRQATGAQPDADLENVLADALLTPEGVEKIRLAEIELQKFEADNGFKFAELEVRREEIAAGDRDSARKMAMAYGSKLVTPQNIIAALFISGYFLVMGLFFRRDIEVPMNEAFVLMLGVLTGGVTLILGFYFGSTTTSQVKTQLLADAVSKQSPAA